MVKQIDAMDTLKSVVVRRQTRSSEFLQDLERNIASTRHLAKLEALIVPEGEPQADPGERETQSGNSDTKGSRRFYAPILLDEKDKPLGAFTVYTTAGKFWVILTTKQELQTFGKAAARVAKEQGRRIAVVTVEEDRVSEMRQSGIDDPEVTILLDTDPLYGDLKQSLLLYVSDLGHR